MNNPASPQWNESEFVTFLLLYCAHVDMNFEDHERDMIKTLIGQGNYEDIEAQFDRCNDAKCIEVIKSYKGLYYPTAERKSELMDKVRKLFEVDGDYSQIEHGVMSQLERLL